MTRQDYELIAKVIREWVPDPSLPPWVVTDLRERIATDMAAALVGTNPRFNRDRFIAAATHTRR